MELRSAWKSDGGVRRACAKECRQLVFREVLLGYGRLQESRCCYTRAATSPSAWRTIRQAATPSATTRFGVVSNRARAAQSRPGHQGFAFAVCWSLNQPTCYEMAVIRNQFRGQSHSGVIMETLQTCWRKLRINSRRRASICHLQCWCPSMQQANRRLDFIHFDFVLIRAERNGHLGYAICRAHSQC